MEGDVLQIPVPLVGAIMMIGGFVLLATPFCFLGLLVIIIGFLISIVGLITDIGRTRETVVYVPAQPRFPVDELGAQGEQRFCTQCGGRIEAHDRFCGSCGSRIPGK